ncbi:MAG: 2-oxo acid dehydrogenase subunit E2, partial [Planctomycetota bacterium]
MPTLKMPEVKGTGQPTVLRWCKTVGDTVKKGAVLLLTETDAELIEVESGLDGTLLEVLSPPGKRVPFQTPLAVLGAVGQAVSLPPPSQAVSLPPPSQTVSLPPPPQAGQPAPQSAGPVIPIVMPKAGQSMEEGMIVKWNVEPGARIQKGQIIFTVETDKATIEVEAVDEGRLARIVVPQGETVPVQAPVAYIAEKDSDVDTCLAQPGGVSATDMPSQREGLSVPTGDARMSPRQTAGADTSVAQVVEGGRVKASPAARKLAQERGINLAALGAGSGPEGRILSTDVAAAKAGAAVPAALAAGQVRRRMSQMRKAIARNLLWSKQNIPHFYLRLTVNAEPLLTFYKQEKAKYPCSVNDVVVAACAKAIHEFAAFRCKLDGADLIETPTANIGVAVGMEEGLAVPVIVAAERLTLQQIGAESKRLAEAARKGKLEGQGEGVFTITNLGMFGVEEFAAIINPTEAAILAVGAAHEA